MTNVPPPAPLPAAPTPLPPPRQMGCCAQGCLILAALFLFLLVAGAIGMYYGMRSHSAVVHAFAWASRTHVLAQEPSPVPQFETTEPNILAATRKWDDFETATRRHEGAHVELTADDLNNLIARHEHLRGKVFVSIENTRLRVQTSVPLNRDLGKLGAYLNSDIVIQGNGRRSLDQPPFDSVTVNGQALPSDVLNWKYRSRSLGDYAAGYRGNIQSFEIRDGKIILDSREGTP